MGDKQRDRGNDEPSLELPSLRLPRLGRLGRRGRGAEEDAAGSQPDPAPAQPTATRPDPAPDPRPEPAREPPRAAGAGSGLSLPAVPGWTAALVTGLLVGALGTLLTYAAMAGCEAVRGTSTCGGPGIFLLVAIFALMTLSGTLLLSAWKVADATSTSFLAVGLTSVVLLLVLIDVLFSGWMFVVVPLLTGASYAFSHWLTGRFSEA